MRPFREVAGAGFEPATFGLCVLIPSAVIGLLTVVFAVVVHEVSELLAVGNGFRAARRPVAAPAASPA